MGYIIDGEGFSSPYYSKPYLLDSKHRNFQIGKRYISKTVISVFGIKRFFIAIKTYFVKGNLNIHFLNFLMNYFLVSFYIVGHFVCKYFLIEIKQFVKTLSIIHLLLLIQFISRSR